MHPGSYPEVHQCSLHNIMRRQAPYSSVELKPPLWSPIRMMLPNLLLQCTEFRQMYQYQVRGIISPTQHYKSAISIFASPSYLSTSPSFLTADLIPLSSPRILCRHLCSSLAILSFLRFPSPAPSCTSILSTLYSYTGWFVATDPQELTNQVEVKDTRYVIPATTVIVITKTSFVELSSKSKDPMRRVTIGLGVYHQVPRAVWSNVEMEYATIARSQPSLYKGGSE